MSKYWKVKLKCLNTENWKQKCMNIEIWNVQSKDVMHIGKKHYNIVYSHKHPHKVTIYFEPSKPE
jgi:hypothetical protein